MRFFRRLFDFYINASIHVGIEVCCFVLVTGLGFGFGPDWFFLGFVFFGTITGYNFIKYAGIAKWRHRSLATNLKYIQVFSLFCFLAFVFFALKLPFDTLLLTAFFGVFTIFYVVPFFPGKKNLRSVQGLKIFIIAFVVSGLTLIVPLDFHNLFLWKNEVALTFFQRLAFIVAVIIPFEIRDIDFDENELGTIPQRIGVQKAKILAMGLLAVFLVLEFFKPVPKLRDSGEVSTEGWLSSLIIALISAGFIFFSTKNQSKYYASFWVEAIPIFWFLEFWLLSRIFA